MKRQYSVSEIDTMRNLVSWDGKSADSFNPEASPAVVEDRLRTYMMAGVGAVDLWLHDVQRSA